MKISSDEIEKIAHLARLEIEESRKEKLVDQLGGILLYIDTLKDVDVEGVRLSSEAVLMNNVFREDMLKPSAGPGVTLAGAPDRDDDFYVVPRIVK